LGLCAGCEEKVDQSNWQGAPPRASGEQPQARSADRLPPGELLEGTESTFGFAVPKGMSLFQSPKSATITGPVDFDALTSYVKDRIAVRHAEMIGDELYFRNAHIRGREDSVFELSIRSRGSTSVLLIKDKTLKPPTFGLTQEQRWKKEGLRPSGRLIDPNQME